MFFNLLYLFISAGLILIDRSTLEDEPVHKYRRESGRIRSEPVPQLFAVPPARFAVRGP